MVPEKLLFIVLDGAPDSISQFQPTALEAAYTPNLDELARRSLGGLLYPVSPGVAPESDVAVLSLLGYEPRKYYIGRGVFEALGAGLSLRGCFEVAFRGNFATIDPSTRHIIDRRVGRSLTDAEAKELAKALNQIKLSEGYVKVIHTIGHRLVVIIGSDKGCLSDQVENIDPAYRRVGRVSVAVPNPDLRLPRCKPLVDTPEARLTCKLVDEFIEKAIEVLENHPVNKIREAKGLLKANAVLLRDASLGLPNMPPLNTKYGKVFAAIVEMPVEKGIARAANCRIIEIPPPTNNLHHDLSLRVTAALDAMEKADIIYIHIKGPDEPGHDGKFEKKVEVIEAIDKFFIGKLLDKIDLDKISILVTSDHATPWTVRSHTGDPVPFLLHGGKRGSKIRGFCERECYSTGIVIKHGWKLLDYVFRMIGWRE